MRSAPLPGSFRSGSSSGGIGGSRRPSYHVIFTAGLADPNLWTNRVDMTDVGFNWYLNKFVKIYFDWEHVMFAQPVYFRPGALQKTNDLFWFRFQVYF